MLGFSRLGESVIGFTIAMYLELCARYFLSLMVSSGFALYQHERKMMGQRKSLYLYLSLFFAFTITNIGYSQPSQYAGESIEVDFDILTVSKYLSSYEEHVEFIRGELQDGAVPYLCPSFVPTQLCISSEPQSHGTVIPSFNVANLESIVRDGPACNVRGKSFSLGPATAIEGAMSAIPNWKELAETGHVFSCLENECLIVLKLDSIYGTPSNHEVLGVCEIDKIGSSLGSPHSCRELLVDNGNEILLPFTAGYSKYSCVAGRPDFDYIIAGNDSLSKEHIVSETLAALKEVPWNLVTEVRRGQIRGIADHQWSKILVGWKENITITLDLYDIEFDDEDVNIFGIEVTTTITVNRQNTSSHLDWTQPSDTQNAVYIGTLRETLSSNLASLCDSDRWIGDYNLYCDLSNSFTLPENFPYEGF